MSSRGFFFNVAKNSKRGSEVKSDKDAPFSTLFRSKCNVPLGALFKHLFRILFLFDNATTEALGDAKF
jgi:hypothetical protein